MLFNTIKYFRHLTTFRGQGKKNLKKFCLLFGGMRRQDYLLSKFTDPLCHSGKTEANFYQSDSKSHTQIHNLHMLCKSCCAYIFALNMQQIDVEKCTRSAHFYNMTRCLPVYFVLKQLKIYFGTKISSCYLFLEIPFFGLVIMVM